jgi:hypothetical protein
MSKAGRNWLQLYVDATMERDPYKRLTLVRELKKLPRQDESGELPDELGRRPVHDRKGRARRMTRARK